MDPVADKLLIVARAGGARVARPRRRLGRDGDHRARARGDGACAGRRSQQGVVIAANAGARSRRSLQVARSSSLIAVDGSPAWLDALVYVTVAVTVMSGVDYFFGLRRRMRGARRARRTRRSERGGAPSAGAVEPLAHRHVLRRRARRCQLAAQLAEQPEALGDDVVLVDRLEVLLAGGDECCVGEARRSARRRRRSSRARSPRRSAGGGGPSRRRRASSERFISS